MIASNVARWDPATGTWSDVGGGTDAAAGALAWDGSGLYVGGEFTTAGGLPARYLARWDPATRRWSPLGSGMDYPVWALEWDGSGLYAGGEFRNAGGVPARFVARWDPGSAAWSPLGGGTDGFVYDLAWDGAGLYVGGSVSTGIARWDPGTGSWSGVGGGTDGYLYSLDWDGVGLYVGGYFSSAGNVSTHNIAYWLPASVNWTDVGGGMDLNGTVHAVSWDGSRLYAGGKFSSPGGIQAPGVARWDPVAATWEPLGSGIGGQFPSAHAFASDGRDTYVGGSFPVVGGKASVLFARFSAELPYDVICGEGLGPTAGNKVGVHAPDGSTTATSFDAYGAGRWGTNVAWGNVAGEDAYGQILTGPGPGAILGPHVRAFRRTGAPLAKVSYFAYSTLRYGLNVAGAGLDGDATHELCTGAGPGAVFGPHVRGWNYDGVIAGAIAKVSFFAYGTLRYGVNAQGGDVDGAGWDEVITGPGPGAAFGPQVRGFAYDGSSITSIARINFSAYVGAGFGVNVGCGDIDGDAASEIGTAAGPDPGETGQFRGFDYDGASVAAIGAFAADPYATLYGGRIGLADLLANAGSDLLAAPGRDPAATARVIAYDFGTGALRQVADFAPFASTYGVNVAGGPLGY